MIQHGPSLADTQPGNTQGETLPNLSPDGSDGGPPEDQHGIPRLWAPGDTPRGLRERQQRQLQEQMQLMGVNQGNGDIKVSDNEHGNSADKNWERIPR